MYTSDGLETISETQPLHSVLASNEQYLDVEHPDYYDHLNNSQAILLNSSNAEYHPSNVDLSPSHYQSLDLQQNSFSQYKEQTTSTSSANPQYSVSEEFHDRYPVEVHTVASPPYQLSRNSSQCSGCAPRSSSKKKPFSSLHDNMIHNRYMTPGKKFTAVKESTLGSNCGKVSMEETQQIIDNIDRLIDH